ncbi:MAG: DNA polymerase/3'-5' exonuclease PolX [Candidatus Eiseniibacteriota bacterium]
MTNADVARILSRIATMLEIDGANPFRVRAYREGARIIESQGEPVAALSEEEGALESLPGIGKDLAAKIRDITRTGTTAIYEEMKARIPLEVVGFTELQGLGPKRVKTLFEQLGIQDRASLEAAARDGKLRELPGFGEKVEQNVLKALASARQWAGRVPLAGAWAVAHAIAGRIAQVRGVERVEIAGSFRRRKETVGDLDVLACGGNSAEVMQAFVSQPDAAEVLGHGETKSSIRLRNGLQVDLRHVAVESFGAALLYFTGSKAHNIELRKIAINKGLSLNEYGLTRGERTVAARTEADVYAALGLAYIPPELREAEGEIELARGGRLPVLVEEHDLVADLHMHTDRSDGRDTLEAMVRAARDRGYRYCAITEHSKAIGFGIGFDEARVARSADEIAAVREQIPDIQVLHGLEVDILGDGDLDLGEAGLAMLDWVIVSLHSRLDQPPEVATARVLKALAHPRVCAMAHPTGRMIGSRQAAAFDMERVLERAAELGVAMEINAQPDRLDLKDAHARLAREKGVRMVIDTDAHSVAQLDFMRYGVFTARRAGLTKDDVLNTLPHAGFLTSLRKPPARAAGERRGTAADGGTTSKPRAESRSVKRRAASASKRPQATKSTTGKRKTTGSGRGKKR